MRHFRPFRDDHSLSSGLCLFFLNFHSRSFSWTISAPRIILEFPSLVLCNFFAEPLFCATLFCATLFCALLCSFDALCLQLFCSFSHFCACLRPTAFGTTTFGNFRIMYARAFGSWVLAPKCLFFRGFEDLTEVFEPAGPPACSGMSARPLPRKPPLWAVLFRWGVAKGSSVSWVATLKGDKNSECKLSNGLSRSYKVKKLLLSAGR